MEVTHLPGLPCAGSAVAVWSFWASGHLSARRSGGGTRQIEHILIHGACHARHLDPGIEESAALYAGLRDWIKYPLWCFCRVMLSKSATVSLAYDEAAMQTNGWVKDRGFDLARTLIALTAENERSPTCSVFLRTSCSGENHEGAHLAGRRPRDRRCGTALVLAVSTALGAYTYTGRPLRRVNGPSCGRSISAIPGRRALARCTVRNLRTFLGWARWAG